ncbi:MAG: aldolase/citrate lyase family protein, partial [Myxococcota bacterium]
MTRKDRLHRSELAVPGTNLRAMEKAATLDADVVFLDLEDSVAPDDKEAARGTIIEALG